MILKTVDAIKFAILNIVQNARIRVTELEVRLQIHVVTIASFEVLLRRSFFTLTKCEIKNYVNEDQVIILTNSKNRS